MPVVLPRPGFYDPPPPAQHASKKTRPASNATGSNAAASTPAAPHLILGTIDTPEQNIAVSPFINWIAQNPNAGDVARQAQGGYSVNGVAENAIGSNDLFYNIRFPYTGSADTPPGSSAVIYSTPKK